MRILIVSHPPLDPELGAAQVALELAAALRRRGHEVTAWSPEPITGVRWWRRYQAQRDAIERYVSSQPAFDAIDLPPISATRALAERAWVVARSTQPDFGYQKAGIRELARTRPVRALAHLLYALAADRAITQGMRAARRVLCQGSLETRAVAERLPGIADRLRTYVVAPPDAERALLREVRARRQPPGARCRFLWIGRWSAHKDPARLVEFLRSRLPGCKDTATIAGCGEEARAALPDSLLRSGRLTIVPRFPRRDLPALLARHDAGLFTSVVEGWGLSLSEMLESGMPVYATEAGGVPDLAPFFPGSLRPFPPPPGSVAPASPPTGYDEAFSWAAIAERYERDALGDAA